MGKGIPTLTKFREPNIGAVVTIFNVFSYGAASDQDSNLSSPRRRAVQTVILPLVLGTAPPEESSTGVTGDGSIVEMGGGRIPTNSTLFTELG